MKKKSYFPLFFALCASILFFVLRCTQSTKPLEKPRLTAMADTTVNAGDTIRLYALPVFVPDSIVYYLWCFSGIQTVFDTTSAPFVNHVWAIRDSGVQRFMVKLADSRRIISDSTVTRITVRVCRPIIALSGDSSAFAGDSTRFVISDSGPCPANTYVWSFNNALTFSDTTLVPTILKHWSQADTGVHKITAFALTRTAIPSFPDTLTVSVTACRPNITISGNSMVFSGDSDLYSIASSGSCPAQIYVWSFNNGVSFTDTTISPTFLKRWSESDTGIHKIAAFARTQAGVNSKPCSLSIKVVSCKLTLRLSGDSSVFAGDSNRYTVSVFGACPAQRFLWSFNNGNSFTDTTVNPAILKHWSEADTIVRKIAVFAQTQTGTASIPDTLAVSVVSCKPIVRVSGDSVAFPLDTTRLIAAGFSNCGAPGPYSWSFDAGVSFKDTVFSNFYVKQWNVGDTGLRLVAVKTTTAAGLVSSPDTLRIRIRSDISPVQLPLAMNVQANDTTAISAHVVSKASTVSRFFWTVDHALAETPTLGNTLRVSWPPSAVGKHSIRLRATDDRMTGSIFDSMTVTVIAQLPTLVHPRDTVVSRTDTVIVTLQASESGAQIVAYLWNIGGLTWTDSGTTPQHKIAYFGKDTATIGVGIRDNRGMITIDSFHIYYDAPPQNLRMLSPLNGDTIRYKTIDSTFAQKRVTFKFSALDPNGKSDSLTFALYLGKSGGQPTLIYQGRDSLFVASNVDTAQYSWKLIARDKLGDSAVSIGGFTIQLQQTICFAGHSIVVGYTSDGTTGGFRKKVLSTMRSAAGVNARIKATGPLTTNYLTPRSDDSCFAVNGWTAKELFGLMSNSFPTFTADKWVVMLGVNGGYYYSELYYLMFILNQIHANNPRAGIYVINGLPLTASYGQDKIFNGWLSDSIAARKKLNWNISNIDAFTKFAINDTPNPALFTLEPPSAAPGYLHPNQIGYDTLANLILRTMGIMK